MQFCVKIQWATNALQMVSWLVLYPKYTLAYSELLKVGLNKSFINRIRRFLLGKVRTALFLKIKMPLFLLPQIKMLNVNVVQDFVPCDKFNLSTPTGFLSV